MFRSEILVINELEPKYKKKKEKKRREVGQLLQSSQPIASATPTTPHPAISLSHTHTHPNTPKHTRTHACMRARTDKTQMWPSKVLVLYRWGTRGPLDQTSLPFFCFLAETTSLLQWKAQHQHSFSFLICLSIYKATTSISMKSSFAGTPILSSIFVALT